MHRGHQGEWTPFGHVTVSHQGLRRTTRGVGEATEEVVHSDPYAVATEGSCRDEAEEVTCG